MLEKARRLDWWSSFGAPPELDLAREEAMLGTASPCPQLFTYSWNKRALVLGYGQRDLASIDLEFCHRERISVLRRCSGGTAVYQESDLAFSLVLPKNHAWAEGIRSLYGHLVEVLQGGLAELGLDATRPPEPRAGTRSPICFEGRGDETLLIGGRKVAGGAQVRRKESVLAHFVVLFTLDVALQAALFGVEPGRIERAMTALPAMLGLTPEVLAGRLAAALAERLEICLEARGAPEGPAPEPGHLRDPRWVLIP